MLQKILLWRDQADQQLLELLSGSSVALILKLIGAGLAFTFNVLLARLLGAEGAGVYFLALSVITVAVVFGRLGLDKTVLRLISANSGENNWSAVNGVQRKATIIIFISSAGATIVVLLLTPWLTKDVFQKPELLRPLQWMALAIIPTTFNFIYAHMLKGRKLIFAATWIENVSIAVLSVIFFYFLGSSYSIIGAAWSYLIAVTLTAITAIIVWRKAVPQIRGTQAVFDTKTILAGSLPLFWVALTTWILSRFGDFALGIWSTAAEVGIFAVASRTALFISFSLLAVNSIAGAQFAALHYQNDHERLTKSARHAIRITTLAALPLFLLCIIAPDWIMSIFGEEFVIGSTVLVVLAIAQFINAATGPVELLLMMSGQERLVQTNVMAVGALNIMLYIWLVPNYGAMGAAIAFAIGIAIKNLISVWLVQRHLGIKLYGF